ncbi:hypothetical protein BGX24_002833 [Mortierella sp. AD032]|nr:hypothetical protein BGX24_002833 [Mortierella sp. AD032]
MPPPRHQSASAALASIRRHVHQWVGLVLYNSIYQNIFLLHIYRIFKFIYGFINRSTELSRICGASSSSSFTPLDSLWNTLGQPTSTLVNNIHAGTIVYSNPSSSSSSVTGNGRRASVQVLGTAAASTSSPSPALNDLISASSSTLAATARSSTESSASASSVQSSALDSPSAATLVGEQQQELRQRKKRNDSTASSLAHTTAIMDLRQSKAAAGMIYRIDRCILFSKELTAERRELEALDCDPIQITRQILRKKRFPDSASLSTPAARKLQYALERVASTHQLAREINQRVHTKYDSTNPAHERKLLLLWDLLRPQDKLDGRYTKQWGEIGFQGKDPATDFRGMGMLGLDDLVYYAKYYPMSSKHALECSHDPISWYSFAIVGINITAFAVQTLRTRQLQYYLFLNGTDRSVYHELYCYLFHRFNAYWSTLEPKPSIMDFERVFADFKIVMERQLARRKLMMLRYDTKENFLSGHGHHIPPSVAIATTTTTTTATIGGGGMGVGVPSRVLQDEAVGGEAVEMETRKSK